MIPVKFKIPWPREIPMGGHFYTVEQNLIPREAGFRAEINHVTRVIRIDSSSPIEIDKTCSFIHEILHCIDANYSDERMSETMVKTLSEGLFQVFNSMGIEIDWRDGE